LVLAATCRAADSELKDFSLEQLMNLKVMTASRLPQPLASAPATLYVLTERDIRVLGATSVVDLLRNVPGLDVMTAWDTEIEVGVRGLDTLFNAKLLVLLDGHRVNEDFSGAVRWKELPVLLEDIERVEISLTPNSALYGANAFGGIIQIFTKPASQRRGLRLEAQAGNKEDQAYSASYGGSLGKLDFALMAATGKSEGWGNRDPNKVQETVQPIPPSTVGGAAKLKDWSDLTRVALRADWPVGQDDRLSLRGGFVSGRLGNPDLSSTAGKAADNPMATDNGYGQLVYAHDFEDRAGLEAQVESTYWHDGGSPPDKTVRHDGEVRYWHRLGESLRLTAGLAGEGTLADSVSLPQPHMWDSLYAGYGQMELWRGERFSLTGGLRYDKNTDMAGVFSPRGTAVLVLAEGHTLRYGVGTAFRKASFLETYSLFAGAPPATSGITQGMMEYPGGQRRPERLTYHDLAYQGLLNERLSLRFGLFRYEVRDLIILNKIQPYPPYQYAVQYSNLQGVNIDGGETELRWVPIKAWQAFGNVSYQYLDYTEPIGTSQLSVPKIKGNLGLTYEAHGLSGSLVGHYVGAKPADFGVTGLDGVTRFMPIDSYTTLDTKLAYSVILGRRGSLEFGLTVLNVLDDKHMEYPVSDGSNSYFGLGATPYNEEQRRDYENRNALNDRRILGSVAWRF